MLAKQILDSFNIKTKLLINSLGDKETRKNYSKSLKEYFQNYKNELSKDSINRLEQNPLRILDDKIDGKKEFVKNAPKIDEFYSKDIKEYFNKVILFLKQNKIDYEWDKTLVRGLDYYSDTTFEFVSISGNAGSQSTILGGGRYSELVSEFGGPDLSGVGFGLGIERILNELDLDNIYEKNNKKVDIFVLNISKEMQEESLNIVSLLRNSGLKTEWNPKVSNIQKAFKSSEKSGASINILPGIKEWKDNSVVVKMNQKQEVIKIDKLIDDIKRKLEIHENN